MAVANLSLSSKSEAMFAPLHEVADEAYFAGTLLVAAANNQPGPTYPSQYASVVSVAARPGADPWALAYNPRPPVSSGRAGSTSTWRGGGGQSIVATGNSFAAPHVAGMAAVLLAKHPGLTPFQVKAVLQAVSENAGDERAVMSSTFVVSARERTWPSDGAVLGHRAGGPPPPLRERT